MLPPEVQARMEAYASRFYILKTPRKLVSGVPSCPITSRAMLAKTPAADGDRPSHFSVTYTDCSCLRSCTRAPSVMCMSQT